MYKICFTINGKRRCIIIPLLVDMRVIKIPPPENFPELELALTVMQLARVIKSSELSKQLTDVSARYVEQFKKQLPAGVEIHEVKANVGR